MILKYIVFLFNLLKVVGIDQVGASYRQSESEITQVKVVCMRKIKRKDGCKGLAQQSSPVLFMILICIGLFLLSSCGKGPPADADKVYPVKLMVVPTGQGLAGQTFPGNVRAVRRVDLSFQVAGPLMELPIEEGQVLNKGDLVARIRPRDFETDMKEARARLLEAEQQFDRYKDLFSRNQVSKADVDKYRSARDVARAHAKAASDALNDTYLRAPFTGVVARRYVENFEEVQAKQAIVNLQDISKVEILVDIPETLMAVEVNKDSNLVYAEFPAAPGRKFQLKIKEFSAEADPQTHTYQGVLVMPHPGDVNILPGMTADVTGAAQEKDTEGKIRIPAIAVMGDPKGKGFVWVVDDQMIARKRSVTMGPMTGSKSILIADGLEVGETIVVEGLTKLHDGVKVTLQTDKTKGAGK